jgi:hypothetical protein
MAADIFKRLSAGRPAATTKKSSELASAQLLLDFVQRWGKDTICGKDIQNYGPGSIRDRKSRSSAAEALVEFGWLIPVKPHQRNMNKWLIVRKPIVGPRVAG